MTVYWAVLLDKNVAWECVDPLLDVAAQAARNGYVRIAVPHTRTDTARNKIAQVFVDQTTAREDVLVMLDNDHAHPADIIERLARRPEGVASALAFRRSLPHDPLFYIRDDAGRLRQPAEWEPGTTYICNAVATGAIAIKRWVFDELTAAGYSWPWFRYEYPEGVAFHPSEDLYFAGLCEKAGIRQVCDTGLVIPHMTTAFVDQSTWAAVCAHDPTIVEQEA